jgi:hypothetical protein
MTVRYFRSVGIDTVVFSQSFGAHYIEKARKLIGGVYGVNGLGPHCWLRLEREYAVLECCVPKRMRNENVELASPNEVRALLAQVLNQTGLDFRNAYVLRVDLTATIETPNSYNAYASLVRVPGKYERREIGSTIYVESDRLTACIYNKPEEIEAKAESLPVKIYVDLHNPNLFRIELRYFGKLQKALKKRGWKQFSFVASDLTTLEGYCALLGLFKKQYSQFIEPVPTTPPALTLEGIVRKYIQDIKPLLVGDKLSPGCNAKLPRFESDAVIRDNALFLRDSIRSAVSEAAIHAIEQDAQQPEPATRKTLTLHKQTLWH